MKKVLFALFTVIALSTLYEMRERGMNVFALDDLTVPVTFGENDTIYATDFNRNFDSIETHSARTNDSLDVNFVRFSDFEGGDSTFSRLQVDTAVIDTARINSLDSRRTDADTSTIDTAAIAKGNIAVATITTANITTATMQRIDGDSIVASPLQVVSVDDDTGLRLIAPSNYSNYIDFIPASAGKNSLVRIYDNVGGLTWSYGCATDANSPFVIYENGSTNSFTVEAGGDAGFNVADPENAVHIRRVSGDAALQFEDQGAGEFVMGIEDGVDRLQICEGKVLGTTIRMSVEPDGKVGIGEIANENLLEVAGTVEADSVYATAGALLNNATVGVKLTVDSVFNVCADHDTLVFNLIEDDTLDYANTVVVLRENTSTDTLRYIRGAVTGDMLILFNDDTETVNILQIGNIGAFKTIMAVNIQDSWKAISGLE